VLLIRLYMSFPHYVIWQEGTMIRERALKVVLVIVGLLFLAGVYPLWRLQLDPSEQMLGGV
jgi:hypothetical protein